MFTITVHADEGAGKTTVLMLILDMLADHGLLSVEDTRHISHFPHDYMGSRRHLNGHSEAVTVALDEVMIVKLAVMSPY